MNKPNEFAAGTVSYPSDVERIVDISGPSPDGRPKAHVLLKFYYLYSDGTTKDIRTLTIDKPIVSIWTDGVYAHVDLDFGSRTDMDLRMAWEILSEFKRPENSIRFLPEEWDAGFYESPTGPKLVYHPIVDLALSPIGKEDSYMIYAYKPLYFGLTPNRPDGDACVLRIVFEEASLSVVNDLDRLNHETIRDEIMAEMEEENRRAF